MSPSICRFERKIGRKVYLIEATRTASGVVDVKAFVEKPVKIKGQEVFSGFFTPTEWLGFQDYADKMLKGVS